MKQLRTVACGLLVAVGLWLCLTQLLTQQAAQGATPHTSITASGPVVGGDDTGDGSSMGEIEWP